MAKNKENERPNRSAVDVCIREPSDKPDDVIARTLTRPEVQAAAVIQKWEGEVQEVNAVIRELECQVADVAAGSLRRGEATLVAQAHTLDELFSHLARKAHAAMPFREGVETYLRLALKAQAQCRATWQTLAEMKNPCPVAVFNQANISNGPQQVNNGPARSGIPRAATASDKNQPNELLETQHGEWLDTRTASTAGRANQELATVGAIIGADLGDRKGKERAEP